MRHIDILGRDPEEEEKEDDFNINHLRLWREVAIPARIESEMMTDAQSIALQSQNEQTESTMMTPTPFGGAPPVGWGVHAKEEKWWYDTPRYAKHPISEKMEAVGGLYHRLWPEHVEQVLQMKRDRWPHRDIIEVVKEFWSRQQKHVEEKQHSMDSAKQARSQNFNEQLDHVMSPRPNSKQWEPNDPENAAKSANANIISMAEYKKLMKKGDTTGGERVLTPKQRKVRQNQDWERSNVGVMNAPPTEIEEKDKTELVSIETVGSM